MIWKVRLLPCSQYLIRVIRSGLTGSASLSLTDGRAIRARATPRAQASSWAGLSRHERNGRLWTSVQDVPNGQNGGRAI